MNIRRVFVDVNNGVNFVLETCSRTVVDLSKRILAIANQIIRELTSSFLRIEGLRRTPVLEHPALKRELDMYGVQITPELCRSFNPVDQAQIGSLVEFLARVRGDHARAYGGGIADWQDLRTRTQLKKHFRDLFRLMSRDPQLRETILQNMAEVVNTCIDRIGLGYSQIVGLLLLYGTRTLEEKSRVILGIARGDVLDRKVEALKTLDPIEDKLFARIHAKAQLGLPHAPKNFYYRGCVRIDQEIVARLIREVKEEENPLLVLMDSQLWREEIVRRNQPAIKKVQDNFDDTHSIPEDPEVARVVAFEREEVVTQKIQELTVDFISAHPNLQRF